MRAWHPCCCIKCVNTLCCPNALPAHLRGVFRLTGHPTSGDCCNQAHNFAVTFNYEGNLFLNTGNEPPGGVPTWITGEIPQLERWCQVGAASDRHYYKLAIQCKESVTPGEYILHLCILFGYDVIGPQIPPFLSQLCYLSGGGLVGIEPDEVECFPLRLVYSGTVSGGGGGVTCPCNGAEWELTVTANTAAAAYCHGAVTTTCCEDAELPAVLYLTLASDNCLNGLVVPLYWDAANNQWQSGTSNGITFEYTFYAGSCPGSELGSGRAKHWARVYCDGPTQRLMLEIRNDGADTCYLWNGAGAPTTPGTLWFLTYPEFPCERPFSAYTSNVGTDPAPVYYGGPDLFLCDHPLTGAAGVVSE